MFASSAAVYGNSQELPIRPDSPTNPISEYGRSKLAAERLCLNVYEENGFGTTVLRYFNVYGQRALAGQYGSVTNQFLERLAKIEAPIINGDGNATRDFIFVKDVAQANLKAALCEKSIGKIYNVGTERKTTINDLANLEMKIILGEDIVLPLEYGPKLPKDILDGHAEITQTAEELGFHTNYSLEEGLREYFRSLWPSLPLKQDGSKLNDGFRLLEQVG